MIGCFVLVPMRRSEPSESAPPRTRLSRRPSSGQQLRSICRLSTLPAWRIRFFAVLLLFEQLPLAGSTRRTSQERAADADDNSERSGELSAESEVALELALWELESFLDRYPDGTFALLARPRLDAAALGRGVPASRAKWRARTHPSRALACAKAFVPGGGIIGLTVT